MTDVETRTVAPSRVTHPAPVILITGAAGRIGRLLRRSLRSDPDVLKHLGRPFSLRVTDILEPGDGDGPGATDDGVFTGDLANAAFVDSLFADRRVYAVIHLAGFPREADWDVLIDANLRSSINIWEAARKTGVDRVLYASSNHAIGLYPRTHTIDDTALPRPDSRYGLTKVFGEQMGFLYAHKFAVRSFSMRIGMLLPEPTNLRSLSTWLSHPDMVALAKVGLTADYTCEIVYGMSNNVRAFWDNSAAYRLGYRPQDSADLFASKFPGPDTVDDAPAEHFQGGPYVSNGLQTTDRLANLERP